MKTKYPIVQFSEDKQDVCCCYVLPVSEGSDLAFLSPATGGNWYLSNLNGDKLSDVFEFEVKELSNVSAIESNRFIDVSSVDLSAILAPGDCFRVIAGNYFSTPFQYIGCDTDNTHIFEYWDVDDINRQRVRISCVIENPQSKTEKSDYTDSNGVNISLSKTRRKQYSMTTDFYPESVHDAIKEILLYPNILVDDEAMYESDDYDIGWDEKDENDNARATTKLSEQDINRYSIC